MQPNIVLLKSVFDEKVAILKELKRYIKPIEEFAKDEGLANFKQEEEHLILKKHFFGKDKGLLPLIDKLIECNSLLLSYEKPTYLGTAIMLHYDKVIGLVEKEQYFLINFFKKTLVDISTQRGYKEYWTKSFSNYQSLLKILRLDLTYFSLLLQTQAKTEIHWIINLIQMRRIDEAIDFVRNREDAKLLSEAEADFFDKLLKAIKDAKYWDIGKILEEGKELLEEDEFNLLSYVLDKIKDEMYREIKYREIKQEEPQVDNKLQELVQRLGLEEEELESVEEIAEEEMPEIIPEIEEKAEEIEEIIDLIEEVAPEVSQVRRMNINLIKGMTKKEEKALANKKYKKSKLRRLKARFRLTRRKIKRGYKSKKEVLSKALMVLKESADLRKKLSDYLRFRKFNDTINKLNKEAHELKQLSREIQIKKAEFPSFAPLLNQLQDKVGSMAHDIDNAIGITYFPEEFEEKVKERQISSMFSNLWSQLMANKDPIVFVSQLIEGIYKGRKDIVHNLKNLGEKVISRRKFLKLGLAAGGVVAAGGAAALLTRKKLKETKPKEEIKKEVQPQTEEPDLKFDTVTIQEVDKIIYTEGSYKNAAYIVVIPHSTELNAINAARAAAKGPITYVAGNNDRNLKIKTDEGVFQIDPNNAFCMPGIVECFKFLQGKRLSSLRKGTQEYVISSIRKFTDEISRRIFVGKMILALHQNTKGNFGIKSYKYDLYFSNQAAEVFINPGESNDVLAVVNTKGWFEILKAQGWNVVLERKEQDIDTGAISYAAAWKGLPYVNIEVQTGDASKQAQMISVINDLIDKYPLLANDMNFVPP